MSEKSKGTLCGIVAAVSYGMNPLGALSLYRAGINTNSVLFYRYALAAVLLAALLLVQKTSLRITRREFSVLGLLGCGPRGFGAVRACSTSRSSIPIRSWPNWDRRDCPGSRNSTSIWKSDRVSIIGLKVRMVCTVRTFLSVCIGVKRGRYKYLFILNSRDF